LAALVLAGVVVVGLLGWRAFTEWRAQGDREAALEAARSGTAAVLTYSSKTLDADLARAHAAIGGAFVTKFDAVTSSTIVPAARQQDLTSKATVLHAALLDDGGFDPTDRPDQQQALVFVNHATFVNNQPQPPAASSQLKVTMTRMNGEWLITDLRPL
ncbi:MAG: hypothetical protein J2P19_31600, partial [Pseudonocardia sp.]|nr:hypothetical protein [Pseudonocardia sp.]